MQERHLPLQPSSMSQNMTPVNPVVMEQNVHVALPPENSSGLVTFQEMVMCQFAIMAENDAARAAQLTAISARLENFQSAPVVPDVQMVPVSMPSLPIKSIDGLREFEEHLQNDDHFFELVRMVRMIGAVALSDAVKRAWKKVLSLDVRAECNWCSKKKGTAYGSSNSNKAKSNWLSSVILYHLLFSNDLLFFFSFSGGIKSGTQFSKHTETELEVETKAFFKHAPERARQRLQHGSVLRNTSSGNGCEDGPSYEDGQERNPCNTSVGRPSGSRGGCSSRGIGGSSSSRYTDEE
ncbi:hypothetical protein GHT06_003251 [Daphnia sinensis]|uniref:DUF4806 domain-containing protein n=1 Tax=Daphnia sinensis TaxID=1820382 RepID=A0AAD5KW78_9CRUS|nr:hypothetical protein GHT06_001910 [Daphnia sinensis]KAI9551319.1 hypothetical protein GHT06_003251 [Daphnia sinensis]